MIKPKIQKKNDDKTKIQKNDKTKNSKPKIQKNHRTKNPKNHRTKNPKNDKTKKSYRLGYGGSPRGASWAILGKDGVGRLRPPRANPGCN